jgi:hypothetical protein
MHTSLCLNEPLLAILQTSDTRRAASPGNGTMLTIEQRMQLEMFLALFQTWTVMVSSGDIFSRVVSYFAPRLHRNGDIDFIVPYSAGSQALVLITAHPIVTFIVSDGATEQSLEGRAQAVRVEQSWEQDELLAYLQWRMPGASDRLASPIEVVIFRPIYLRYCDFRHIHSSFEVKWQ